MRLYFCAGNRICLICTIKFPLFLERDDKLFYYYLQQDEKINGGKDRVMGLKKKKENPARERLEAELEAAKENAKSGTDDDRRVLARAYDSLAFAYKEEKNIDGALECHLQSYKILNELAEKCNTPEADADLALSCGNVGAICRDIGNIKQAEEFYGKAIALAKVSADKLRTPKSYNNYALLCFEAGVLNRKKPDRELLLEAHGVWEILGKEYPDNSLYKSMRSSVALVLNEKYRKRRGLFSRFAKRRRR